MDRNINMYIVNWFDQTGILYGLSETPTVIWTHGSSTVALWGVDTIFQWTVKEPSVCHQGFRYVVMATGCW